MNPGGKIPVTNGVTTLTTTTDFDGHAYPLHPGPPLRAFRLAVKASGLWGMPELFSVKFEHEAPDDPLAPEQLDRGTDLGLRLAQQLGGSMEHCHGVGLRLSHLMADEWGTGLKLLRDLKRTLDPQNLLNPGKLGL